MPIVKGDYEYTVTFQEENLKRTAGGTFRSVEAHRRGMLAVVSRQNSDQPSNQAGGVYRIGMSRVKLASCCTG